jgi:diacylglycerol kinase (ATP)
MRRVLVLVNPKSGLPRSFTAMRHALDRHWEREGTDLYYQFSQSKADGIAKVQRAVEEGVETILVSGGDGTISTVGRVLIGTDVALGAIPTGSGNGFARHFGIPLSVDRAVEALARATVQPIDVGMVDGTPFLVTCSMAWDAAIVRSFEKFPLRGILPYVLAGFQEAFEYRVQAMQLCLDEGEQMNLPDPIVVTVANLTQFGGGAQVAPSAEADDGYLELVVLRRKDVPRALPQLPRLFDGSLQQIREVEFRRFRTLTVNREEATPIQIDGELVDAGTTVEVAVAPGALNVLVPQE